MGFNEITNKLWESADQLRANSSLTVHDYSAPILGLIFLKYVSERFERTQIQLRQDPDLEDDNINEEDYKAEGVMFIPKEALYNSLLKLPESENLGEKINAAMELIEEKNDQLEGILPKEFNLMDNLLLKELLRIFNDSSLTNINLDLFGRIYEYFLGKFAMTEGQGGGEFYTPESIVKLLVNIIEPYKGKILDPACGTGGMFVQSAKFIESHSSNAIDDISIYGQELKTETLKLAQMNMAVHGFEANIKSGNSYYDDPFNSVGKFDYTLANPPFNVNGIRKEELEDDHRYPFGMPRNDNGNYLWIQHFYTALNEKGRAGFVMANSVSDAGQSELEIRKKLLKTGAVDVMISVSSNFFYTVTLPVTCWFFDKGKPEERKDKVLFIDAREIYRQVDRSHRDFSDKDLSLLTNIVRLYRGDKNRINPNESITNTPWREKLKDIGVGSTDRTDNLFPNNEYKDVKGLCKVANLSEIEAQGWSLNPGRYVGVADEEDDGVDFYERLSEFNDELRTLNEEARKLENQISNNISKILNS